MTYLLGLEIALAALFIGTIAILFAWSFVASREKTSVLRRAVFWTLVGNAALSVAAAVVFGILHAAS